MKPKKPKRTPTPLLKKLRMKGGEEENEDSDTIKQLGDMVRNLDLV